MFGILLSLSHLNYSIKCPHLPGGLPTSIVVPLPLLHTFCVLVSCTGDQLSADFTSNFQYGSWIECGQQCLQDINCTFFNYRFIRSVDDEITCQIINTTMTPETDTNSSDWKLYKILVGTMSGASWIMTDLLLPHRLPGFFLKA